ncbi:MAG TPA: lysylphosphatidylglycerol synthase transmembrane domain-containing protein [Blastocatellia bacterium]|nr:lysylphosphatidylglycerol synthase transmembrane domain-containing protein [Blastocatellia bacterium]
MSKYLKSVLILAIGLALAWWFVSRLDLDTVGGHLRHARIWPLLLAALLINLTLFARSLRWQAFLSPIRTAKFSNLFAATSVGFGAIFVIGRAGEIIRPAVLSLRERIKPTATFATILIERLFDTTAVVSLFAANMLFFELPPDQSNANALEAIRSIGLTLLIGVAVGIFILVLLRLKAAAIIGWMERHGSWLPEKLSPPLLNFIRHLAEGLSVLLDLRALATTIFYTASVWALVCAATWLTLFAFGLSFSLSYTIFVLGFGLVGSVAPTPGGSAGAFHAAAAKGLEFLGLDPNFAASIAIVYHLIAFGPPFIIGLFYLIRDDISLRQLREMIVSETELKNSTQPQRPGDGETERKSEAMMEGRSDGETEQRYGRSATLSLFLFIYLSLLVLKATGGVIL